MTWTALNGFWFSLVLVSPAGQWPKPLASFRYYFSGLKCKKYSKINEKWTKSDLICGPANELVLLKTWHGLHCFGLKLVCTKLSQVGRGTDSFGQTAMPSDNIGAAFVVYDKQVEFVPWGHLWCLFGWFRPALKQPNLQLMLLVSIFWFTIKIDSWICFFFQLHVNMYLSSLCGI